MTLLASLPMYDAPRWARDAFWEALRSRLAALGVADAPAALSEPDDLQAHWRSPDLLFSQTCGAPFATALRKSVVALAVPSYDAPDCDGALYRSVFVVRTDDRARRLADLPGRRAAINGFDSHSGFSQLATTLAPFAAGRRIAANAVVTDGHLRSLYAVRTCVADFAAIDCVTWALAARDEPVAVEGLRIVGRSPASAGLPFITSRRHSAAVALALREALYGALRDPDIAGAREALMLQALSPVTAETYLSHRGATAQARKIWRDGAADKVATGNATALLLP